MYLLKIFFVLSLGAITGLNAKKPVYHCKHPKNKYYHVYSFGSVHLNETHPHLEPSCDIPASSIKKVHIHGKLHTLTSDICDRYPEITHYNASDVGLSRIHLNAFNGCHKLTSLELQENKLTTLPQSLFKNNSLLKVLDLSSNGFTSFDWRILHNTPALKELRLTDNQFEKFLISDMPILPHLWDLYIDKNKFTDLNVERVNEKFPSLYKLFFKNNYMNETKYDEILEYLQDHNVYWIY